MEIKPALAVLGGEPSFKEILPVGQLYWPDWDRYEAAVRDIFDRRYYVSQRSVGPILKAFEKRLSEFLEIENCIAVGNATIGLMLVSKALKLTGKVIVPSWTFIATAQALHWAGCEPLFCDIDPATQLMDLRSVERLLKSENVSGILGVRLWGSMGDAEALEELAAKYGVPLFFDSAHAFGSCSERGKAGKNGSAEVFSFHATKVLSTAEGGCVTTRDDKLAQKVRAMRGDTAQAIDGFFVQSATARMSELQAAVGIMMLDDFEKIVANNRRQCARYRDLLDGVPGIQIIQTCSNTTVSNSQYLVATVEESLFKVTRDQLVHCLKAENVLARRYFYPATNHVSPFSSYPLVEPIIQTEIAAKKTFQLPVGNQISLESIDKICGLIKRVHEFAADVRKSVV